MHDCTQMPRARWAPSSAVLGHVVVAALAPPHGLGLDEGDTVADEEAVDAEPFHGSERGRRCNHPQRRAWPALIVAFRGHHQLPARTSTAS